MNLNKLLRDHKNNVYSEENLKRAKQILDDASHKLQLKEVEVSTLKIELEREDANKNDILTSILKLQHEITAQENLSKQLDNLTAAVGFGEKLPVLKDQKDLLREYKEAQLQSVQIITKLKKKYQTAETELRHLVAKYDNALKLYNTLKAEQLRIIKKENDIMLKRKYYIDEDIKNKYSIHQRFLSKKSGIKKFIATNEKNTLYDIFGNIRTQIEILKYTDQFDDGYSHKELLLPNLEIVLTLEPSYNYDKSFSIIIKFRRYAKTEPCIKILMTLKDMHNAIIYNVDIDKCEPNDNNITVRHCYIILVILLCSFLEFVTIQVRDCNCYNNKKQGYRDAQLNSNNKPERPAYSHHFSYFAPYNFEDVLYNKEKHVLARNDEENDDMSLINGTSNFYPGEQQSYILMTRKSLRNDENFTNYLKKIVLKDVKSMDALAKILKENTSNNLEEEDLYKLLDNNTSSSKTVPPPAAASFGSYSTYSYHV